MADIPYHEWLGLDSKIKNPHHFQLLGVSSKVEDADAYRLKVLAAAQAKLEMLDRIQDTGQEKLVGQLRQRINDARDILSNPEKRADYVKHLKAQIAASKSATALQKDRANKAACGTPATELSKKQRPGDSPAGLPASGSAEKLKLAPQNAKVDSTGPSPPKPRPPVPTSSAIPMAVPIDQTAGELPTGQNSSRLANPIPTTIDPADPDAIDISKLKIKKVKRKQRSRALPVVLVSLALAGIAGGLGIYANFNRLMELAGIDPEQVPVAPGIIKTENTKVPPSEALADPSQPSGQPIATG